MAKRKPRRSFDLLASYNWFVPNPAGLLILLLMFIAGVLLANMLLFAMLYVSKDFAMTYGTMLTYPVMFIPAMLYASYQSHRNELFDSPVPVDSLGMGGGRAALVAVAAAAVTVAAGFVTDLVSSFMPPMSDNLKATLEAMTNGPLWVSVLATVVFAPFFEEWLCRGMVLRGLLQKVGPVWAIVISAAVFGMIHLNLQQAVPAFVLGLLFGFVYYRTGSLKLTMLMHAVNNLGSVLTVKLAPAEIAQAESYREIMGAMPYWCTWAACAAATAALIFALHRLCPATGPWPWGKPEEKPEE